MASERNYWSIDQLWADWHYWRNYRPRTKRDVPKARGNMNASADFIRRCRPALNAPDLHARLAIEKGLYTWGGTYEDGRPFHNRSAQRRSL